MKDIVIKYRYKHGTTVKKLTDSIYDNYRLIRKSRSKDTLKRLFLIYSCTQVPSPPAFAWS